MEYRFVCLVAFAFYCNASHHPCVPFPHVPLLNPSITDTANFSELSSLMSREASLRAIQLLIMQRGSSIGSTAAHTGFAASSSPIAMTHSTHVTPCSPQETMRPSSSPFKVTHTTVWVVMVGAPVTAWMFRR